MSHYHYWLLSRISGHSRENSGQRWISNPETNGLVLKWLWYESQAERIILSTVVNTQDDYNVSESASQLTSGYWHVAPLNLPMLRTAQNHPMLVELKNGETCNGHLVSCDNWMNIHLREVSAHQDQCC